MARLSTCIFEWDPEDVAVLRRSKRAHLQQVGVPGITDAMVDKIITKYKLALHCRRKTRGPETTINVIDHLLQELMGEKIERSAECYTPGSSQNGAHLACAKEAR